MRIGGKDKELSHTNAIPKFKLDKFGASGCVFMVIPIDSAHLSFQYMLDTLCHDDLSSFEGWMTLRSKISICDGILFTYCGMVYALRSVHMAFHATLHMHF